MPIQSLKPRTPSLPAAGLTRLAAALAVVLGCAASAAAQPRVNHYFHNSNLPPGTVGQGMILRGGPIAQMANYVQPVRITAPSGALVSLAVNGQFDQPQAKPITAGMLVGQVYRLRVGNIKFYEGEEVYPTIELVNRLYPPPGQELRFPIPIELTYEELEMAVNGRYVTRIIYLENPQYAMPRREGKHQRYYQVGSKQDPLKVADRLGRPMAILRMGSRIPDRDGATGRFLFGTPPIARFPDVISQTQPAAEAVPAEPAPVAPAGAIQRQTRRFPRLPLPGQPSTIWTPGTVNR